MQRIINAIRRAFRGQTVYVVCRAEDGSAIKNIEVYSDHDRARQRQQELGRGDTCYAERLVDDPRPEKRQAEHLAEMRRRYA